MTHQSPPISTTNTECDSPVWRVTDLQTGYMYTGTPQNIILDMSRQDFIVSSKTDYMLEVQDRVWELRGEHIEVTPRDYTGFLQQLANLGFITITIEQ